MPTELEYIANSLKTDWGGSSSRVVKGAALKWRENKWKPEDPGFAHPSGHLFYNSLKTSQPSPNFCFSISRLLTFPLFLSSFSVSRLVTFSASLSITLKQEFKKQSIFDIVEMFRLTLEGFRLATVVHIDVFLIKSLKIKSVAEGINRSQLTSEFDKQNSLPIEH